MRRLRPWSHLGSDDGFVVQLLMFLVVSVTAGVLVAGLALPFAGGFGLAARSSTEVFDELPQELETPPLAQNSYIYDADKNLIATFYDQNRITVSLNSVAEVMRQAVVAVEDARFYNHNGVDLRGTLRALNNNRSGERVQGGSTLTQQYVKLLRQEAAVDRNDPEAVRAATEQTVNRKVRELRYAIALEQRLTKNQILQGYLNIAYFGSGAYGVEAAARRYFSIHASQLSLEQAATLAGLVQSPKRLDPLTNPEAARVRRNVVLQRMADTGYITQAQAAQAAATKLLVRPAVARNGCETASTAAFFCDYVVNTIRNDPVFGRTREQRLGLLFRGGLRIYTTLDRDMQAAAQTAVHEYVEPTNPVASAMAMIRPGTGEVRAMAVSRGFGDGKGETKINLATDRGYGGSLGFQAGSTFKPFVAAAALEQGLPFTYNIMSPYKKKIGDVKACEGTLKDKWEPANESASENGRYDMRTAMAMSVNTYFAQLEERTGVCRPAQIAEAMGIRQADTAEPLQQIKSFTLGTNAVSPLSMAEAYATFAARGVHCDAIAITKIVTRNGKDLKVPEANCAQVIEQRIADGVTSLLRGVIDGPGPRTGRAMALGRPAAGKTGTTDRRVSVWFIGFTPDLAGAVWAGNPSPPARGYPLVNRTIGGRYYGNICGGCLPGPIWRTAMRGALQDVPASNFAAPDLATRFGDASRVPDLRGLTRAEAISVVEAAGLRWRVRGWVSSDEAVGRVAYTEPDAGQPIDRRERITIFLSTG